MLKCELIERIIGEYMWKAKIKEVNEEILEQVRPCNTESYESHLSYFGQTFIRVDFYMSCEKVQEKAKWGPKISLVENIKWNSEFIDKHYNGILNPDPEM